MRNEIDVALALTCDKCKAPAVWSVCNLEDPFMTPIVRWFACGRHLHSVLTEADWEVDSVHLYDLRMADE